MSFNRRLFASGAAAAFDPANNFAPVTYTGNGTVSASGTNDINTVGFQPDFIWIKNREDASTSHFLVDSVRGATKYVASDGTDIEQNTSNGVSSFDSQGFDLTGNGSRNNLNGKDYIAWCWKGAGAAVSNTDGTNTSQVSANVNLGFSVVKYTGGGGASGNTVGHGLGAIPEMILVKDLDSNLYDWAVYSSVTGNTKKLALNTSAAEATSGVWNNTSPTSSVFTVRYSQVNEAGNNFIAYCFTSKTGVSKVGSYPGATGSVTVSTGFQPRFVLIKKTNTSTNGNWQVIDSARVNSTIKSQLFPDLDIAEIDRDGLIDFLPTGFRINNNTVGQVNASGDSYMYYAIA